MSELSDKVIHDHLRRYGFSSAPQTCEQIRAYISLLIRWNRRISLTGVTDPIDILSFHFGESIFALSAGIVGDGRLADVGAGAGFPGIPLALGSTGLDVTLIEPNLKRCVFLREVKRELGLENIHIVRSRIENVKEGAFDFVVSRAVGRIREILQFASVYLLRSGKVALWLGDEDAEEARSCTKGWMWSTAVRIPGSQRRCILSAEIWREPKTIVPRETK